MNRLTMTGGTSATYMGHAPYHKKATPVHRGGFSIYSKFALAPH